MLWSAFKLEAAVASPLLDLHVVCAQLKSLKNSIYLFIYVTNAHTYTHAMLHSMFGQRAMFGVSHCFLPWLRQGLLKKLFAAKFAPLAGLKASRGAVSTPACRRALVL